jgi:N-acetylneuraminic acid mutarotase
MPLNFKHINAGEQIFDGSFTTPLFADGVVTANKLGVAAGLTIQDITYAAVNGGAGGNAITIQYVEDGIAGLETVTVSGTAITVHIGNHTVLGSTATQVQAAILTSAAASLLVTPVITGTPSNIQLGTGVTSLTGGITGGTGVSSIHADSFPDLVGAVQLVSGTNITLSQTGQAITINSSGSGSAVWGTITGTLSNQTDLETALNSKQNTLTIGNLTDTGTDGITITSGTGSVIGSGTSIAQHVADTTHSGYLSSSDWNTFNSKQPSGNYLTTTLADANIFIGNVSNIATAVPLSGDVSISVSGVVHVNSVQNNSIISSSIASGQVVKSVNSLTDAVVLAAGTNITITPSGNTLTFASTGSGSGTINTGSQYDLAYYAANGTTLSPLPRLGANGVVVTDSNGLPISSGALPYNYIFFDGSLQNSNFSAAANINISALSSGAPNQLLGVSAGANTWAATESLIHAVNTQTQTLLPNGTVLSAGGGNTSVWTNFAEIYTPSSGTWVETGNLNHGRDGHCAVLLLDGQVLLGGGDDGSNILNVCELYNPATGLWTLTGSFNTARYFTSFTLLPNGMVLCAGGVGTVGALTSCELYNPATGLWTVTGSMANARNSNGGTMAVLLQNGTVLIAGGDDTVNPTASAEIYNPVTGTWSATGSLNTARTSQGMNLFPNGTVLVNGGFGPGFTATNTSEIYNPVTGTWSTTGNLNTARAAHISVLLPSGMVLVNGGGFPITNTSELYNPATGTWALVGNSSVSVYNQAATLLPTGEVLMAGGYNGTSTTAVAELFSSLTNEWKTLTGTSNQIVVTNTAGVITLSTPQNIGITSTPTFASLTLTSPLAVAEGGTGTTTPSLIAGTNVTITGSWPDQTINATGGGGSFDVDTILTSLAGEVLVNSSGNVLVA